MASSSNSEFQAIYDIFLSFRGLDTRKKFTDHLYEALKRKGFLTFRDDDEIERGEDIKSELRKAVWNSMMSVIVLSRNYATSTSCLFEIETIIEHRKKNPDHFILPVFYEVNPGEIKEQAKKLDFGEEEATVEKVEEWSAALKKVASMAGMVSKNQSNGYEARFIEEIIGVLQNKPAGKHLRVGVLGYYPTINPPPNSNDDHSEDPNDDHFEDLDDDHSDDPNDDLDNDHSEDPDDDPDDDHSEDPDDYRDDNHSEDPDDDPDDDHSEDPDDDRDDDQNDHSEDPDDDPDDDLSEDPDDNYFEDCDDDYFEDSDDELIYLNQVRQIW